jgi:hypothetical protein
MLNMPRFGHLFFSYILDEILTLLRIVGPCRDLKLNPGWDSESERASEKKTQRHSRKFLQINGQLEDFSPSAFQRRKHTSTLTLREVKTQRKKVPQYKS